MIKLKAFIYRFSAIFGLSIYLAKKEERKYLSTLVFESRLEKEIVSGLWQARNGFTTVITYNSTFYRAFVIRLKHAFDFRSYE